MPNGLTTTAQPTLPTPQYMMSQPPQTFAGFTGGQWGQAAPYAAGGLASLLGGLGTSQAYSGLGAQLGQLQPLLEKYRQMAVGGLAPFQKAGVGALGQFQQALGGMADPQAYINKVMGSYQQSPEAHQQIQQAMQAANQAASASGMLGSGAEQTALQKQAQQLTAADQQRYLQNVLGVGGQYRAGLGQLLGLGAQTGAQMGQFDIGTGQDIANVLARQAQAQAQAQQAQTGGILGGLGGLLGAGLSLFGL
jgi:hypothetical protein